MPDPIVALDDTVDPEHEALVADAVGLALLVVLDELPPHERLGFVLHDVFGVPFAEIAPALHRSEAAAQQLASRARRRVRGSPTPEPALARQREVVQAFFIASRDGEFEALLEVLDPEVELPAWRHDCRPVLGHPLQALSVRPTGAGQLKRRAWS